MKSIKIFIRKIIRGWFFSITNIKWSDKLITRKKVDYVLSLNEIFKVVSINLVDELMSITGICISIVTIFIYTVLNRRN